MPNPSEQSPFSGSPCQRGTYCSEGQRDGAVSRCHYCGTIPDLRNSLARGGGEGGGCFLQDLDRKFPFLGSSACDPVHQPGQQQFMSKTSQPDLGDSFYLKQAMSGRGAAAPPPGYFFPAAPTGQSPEDPGFHRENHQPLMRSASHYGHGAKGLRPLWDQAQARATPSVQASGSLPIPVPPPPPPPPLPVQELSRLYRETLGAKIILDAQRIAGSSSPPPAIYGPQPHLSNYAAEQSSASAHRPINDFSRLSPGPRRSAATDSAVDPTSQGMDGALPRAYGAVASQRLPYDPNYDPSVAMMASAAGMSGGFPPHHPGAADPKKMADPALLAFLRAEGLAESTITLLLQHGFDSFSMLGMMEDHDVRSVAPNLAQARLLSRIVQSSKTGGTAPRTRSNSFSHRNDYYAQPQGLTMDAGLMQQPPSAIQAASPRLGEFLGRRPSSAPSQHLLETTAYPAPRPLPAGALPISPAGYSHAVSQGRPFSMYNAHTGLAMSALGQQPPLAPGTPGAAPKTFSGSYSPIELMKRAPNLPPASPVATPSPLHSPQLLRKGMNAAPESNVVASASSAALQAQNPNATKLVGRRTGPPVIVSTMTTTPDTSTVISLLSLFPLLSIDRLTEVSHGKRGKG